VWQHWLAVLLGAFLFLAWSALSLPATFAVVATSLAAGQHTMGIGIQSLVRRLPRIIGPLIGGWLIVKYGWLPGVRWALLLCIFLNIFTICVQAFILPAAPVVAQPPAIGNFRKVLSQFTPALRELLMSDILIRFCERLPDAFVILWVIDHAKLTAEHYGWLVSIEMITAMVCYIPVAHLADRYGRRPFVLITFIFFTLFPVALMFAESFPWLVIAFVVRGLKEFGEPSRKALIIGEATPAMRARIYGAYYLVRDCVVTLGSFLGAWLWSLGPRANFTGAALFGALGTVWFWWFVYRRPLKS
jgi:MFS family permease